MLRPGNEGSTRAEISDLDQLRAEHRVERPPLVRLLRSRHLEVWAEKEHQGPAPTAGPKRTLMLQNHLSECSLSVCSFATIRCPILTVRDDDEAARVHHASQLRGGDLAARCPRAAV